MIPNEEKEGWHYLAVKKLSALLKGITSKYDVDCYCLNCLRFEQKIRQTYSLYIFNIDYMGIWSHRK